jgi:hypothetical protein
MVFALIVGFLTSSFYVFALKHRHRRPIAGQGRVWRVASRFCPVGLMPTFTLLRALAKTGSLWAETERRT